MDGVWSPPRYGDRRRRPAAGGPESSDSWSVAHTPSPARCPAISTTGSALQGVSMPGVAIVCTVQLARVVHLAGLGGVPRWRRVSGPSGQCERRARSAWSAHRSASARRSRLRWASISRAATGASRGSCADVDLDGGAPPPFWWNHGIAHTLRSDQRSPLKRTITALTRRSYETRSGKPSASRSTAVTAFGSSPSATATGSR